MSYVNIPAIATAAVVEAIEDRGFMDCRFEDVLTAAAPYIVADYLRRIVGLANGLASDEIVTLLTDLADDLEQDTA